MNALEEMRHAQAWTLRVRPILASRQPTVAKVDALIAVGCTARNAWGLARMTVSEFDRTNNSRLRDRAIARLEGEEKR